jgi:hypothetical protein
MGVYFIGVYLMGRTPHRRACRQGIELSCVPYKLCEGAECISEGAFGDFVMTRHTPQPTVTS